MQELRRGGGQQLRVAIQRRRPLDRAMLCSCRKDSSSGPLPGLSTNGCGSFGTSSAWRRRNTATYPSAWSNRSCGCQLTGQAWAATPEPGAALKVAGDVPEHQTAHKRLRSPRMGPLLFLDVIVLGPAGRVGERPAGSLSTRRYATTRVVPGSQILPAADSAVEVRLAPVRCW
jgi:hypothetical protein